LFNVYKANTSYSINNTTKKYGADLNRSDEKNKNTNTDLSEIIREKTDATKNNNLTIGINSENNINTTSDNINPAGTNNHVSPNLNKNSLLKQNSRKEVFNSQNDISENQTVFGGYKKRKFNTKSSSRVKIKNATATEDDQILTESNDKLHQDIKISTLMKINDFSTENTQRPSLVFIDTKKLTKSIDVTKLKVSDTINNKVKTYNKKSGKESRFSITPFFSPDIAWYSLEDDKVNQQENASKIEKEENQDFSYTYGAFVDYKINNHWGMQSGITLSNTNIIVDPKTIYAQQDNTGKIKYRINTSTGYGYVLPAFSSNPTIGDSIYAFTFSHSLQYVCIPIAVTYSFTKGQFTVKAIAGLSTNILTKAKIEATLENGFDDSFETVNNLDGLKKVCFSGMTGLGLDYKLSKKTSLVFAPNLRFALNSITKDAPVKSYPVSLSLALGLKIVL
jgi:hypothetical protein